MLSPIWFWLCVITQKQIVSASRSRVWPKKDGKKAVLGSMSLAGGGDRAEELLSTLEIA